MEKDQEKDQNMAKSMKQLEILSKNVIGVVARNFHFKGVSCANTNEAKFEALYSKEVNFLTKQCGSNHLNYPS